MRLEIVTDGDANHTEIKINGEAQRSVVEFHFSVRGGRRCKMFMVSIDPETHKKKVHSAYGADFAKMDEEPIVKKGEIHYVGEGNETRNSGEPAV